MPKEKEFFIRVLRDHLAERPTEVSEEELTLDWDVLMRLVRTQAVEGIFYTQLRDRLPEIVKINPKAAVLSKWYAVILRFAVERESFLASFDATMTEKKIPYLLFKGIEIAECYPSPQLRTMGDLDILVRPEDKEAVDHILSDFGWKASLGGMNEWFYSRTSGNGADVRMDIELHHRLMYDEPCCTENQHLYLDAVWDHSAVRQSMRYQIDDNFHLTYLMLHLRKHFMNSGVGIRQFVDVAVFARSKKIDWDRFSADVKMLEIDRFSSICFALIEKWFGISLPTDHTTLSQTMIDEATEKILDNGLFGFDDEKNAENRSIEEVFNRKDGTRKKKSQLIIHELFPPLREMQMRRRYLFLKKHPVLLPVAWGYRFVRAVLHAEMKLPAKRIERIAGVNAKMIENRRNELSKWGL